MTHPKRKPRWRVWRQSLWPICLGRRRSQQTPVWVWGDLKLAREIVRRLNEKARKG